MWTPNNSYSDSNLEINGIRISDLKEDSYKVYDLDLQGLKTLLSNCPAKKSSSDSSVVLSVPNIDGSTTVDFKMWGLKIFDDESGIRYPGIKSYYGVQVDGGDLRIKASVSFKFEFSVRDSNGNIILSVRKIDSHSASTYLIHNDETFPPPIIPAGASYPLRCCTQDDTTATEEIITSNSAITTSANEGGYTVSEKRTFKIVLSTMVEFGEYYINTAGAVTDLEKRTAIAAELNNIVLDLNDFYEGQLGIDFELHIVDDLLYIDSGSATYPYHALTIPPPVGQEFAVMNTIIDSISQNDFNSKIPIGDYSIGHVLGGYYAGGLTKLGVAGGVRKAEAITCSATPTQGRFGLFNYVLAHEIGHMFSAGHTFSNSVNNNSINSMEPDAGSSVMGYGFDVSPKMYFNYISIKFILKLIDLFPTPPFPGMTIETIGTQIPLADAGNDHTIPKGTAYKLTGGITNTITSGPNNLFYNWEQQDPVWEGPVNNIIDRGNFGPNYTYGAQSKSYLQTDTGDIRHIPILSRVISGDLTYTSSGSDSILEPIDTVSNVARTLTWGFSVKNGELGTDTENGTDLENVVLTYDSMTITVTDDLPFQVGSITNSWTPGDTETVTWTVGSTNSPPINVSEVNIKLSVDGGLTYPHSLVSNGSNNGTATFTVPYISPTTITTARVIVEPVDNIFFAINDSDFSINSVAPPQLSMTKTANAASANLNDTITYSFLVTNTGGVTVDNITVSDPLPGLDFSSSGSSITSLVSNASGLLTATYSVGSGDVTAGTILNTATAIGYSGSTVVMATGSAEVAVNQAPAPAPAPNQQQYIILNTYNSETIFIYGVLVSSLVILLLTILFFM